VLYLAAVSIVQSEWFRSDGRAVVKNALVAAAAYWPNITAEDSS